MQAIVNDVTYAYSHELSVDDSLSDLLTIAQKLEKTLVLYQTEDTFNLSELDKAITADRLKFETSTRIVQMYRNAKTQKQGHASSHPEMKTASRVVSAENSGDDDKTPDAPKHMGSRT